MHLTVTRENMLFLPLEGMVSEHTNIDIYFLHFFHFIYIVLQVILQPRKQNLCLFKFSDNSWLFAHEAGHCLGGMHVRPKGVAFLIYKKYFLNYKILII